MFLLIVLFIYCLMHYYLYAKVNAAFALNNLLQNAVLVIMIVMVLSVFLVQALSINYVTVATFLAYPTYFWLAFLFLFTVSGLCLDAYNLVIRGCTWLCHDKISKLKIAPVYVLFIPVFLAIAICIYGFFAGCDISVKSLTISTNKLPMQVKKLRIVQISDLHLGLVSDITRLQKIVNLINTAHPDLVVSTGDLFDSNSSQMDQFLALLKSIKAPLGKYAVTGNHEFIFGIKQSTDLTERAGFKLLRQETVLVDHKLTVIGVDDAMATQFGIIPKTKEAELLQKASHQKFALLLKHRPTIENDAQGLFDLQLSGHTHRGQIFPFYLVVRLFFPYVTGVLHSFSGSYLYTTNGAGMFGPQIRFLAPPEIVVIDLVRV